jgi:mannose/fructose/N-acetylgalactosamine-specific phosphotransferase system component IIB
MNVDGRHHRDEAEKPRDNLARDQEEKRMLRNLRMTEVAIMNRDVGETSAVGTCGTV